MIRRLPLLLVIGALMLVVGSAFTALNVVGSSRAGQSTTAVTAVQLAPPECAGMPLTRIRVGGGGGGGGNQLILGTPGNDVIGGGGGRDCILGGAGNDRINGGGGSDVCLGGPGNDVFVSCETQYQ